MTISRVFVKFLENKGYGIFGQNIYLFRVPSSLKTETEVMWVIPSGGQIVGNNRTGEKIKSYQFLVYFRANDAKKVDAVLSDLEELFSCSECVELDGYDLVDLQVSSFPVAQDLDTENRMFGFIQVRLQVYKKC